MFNKNVFTQTDVVADLIKGINEADYKAKMEALKGNQHKIDKNKNNKVDADDFKILRGEKKVNEDQVEEATSVKIPTSTGTRVLGHRYGNAAKTHRDSMADPFAVVKGPGQKDIEDLEKKKVKKEEIDPEKVTTDTLAGRVKGKTANPFAPKKVLMDVPDNVKEEAEDLDEATEKKTDFMDRQKRLAAASAETQKDPARLKRMSGIPGYTAAMDLAKKTTTKEEVEQLDEIGDTPAGLEKVKAYRAAVGRQAHKTGEYDTRNTDRKSNPFHAKDKAQFPANKTANRIAGAAKAKKIELGTRYAEEVEQMDERELSKGETAEKERIVKGMKKSLAGFKSRYGDKAKSVMYATATKQAKKD